MKRRENATTKIIEFTFTYEFVDKKYENIFTTINTISNLFVHNDIQNINGE